MPRAICVPWREICAHASGSVLYLADSGKSSCDSPQPMRIRLFEQGQEKLCVCFFAVMTSSWSGDCRAVKG